MTTHGPVSAESHKGRAPAPVSVFAKLQNILSSKYALSVGAQALVSGFHFGLNFLLIRLITPYDYGIFAYAFVLALFASAINNALISTPLTVYTPVIKNLDERAQQEAMFSTLNLLLFSLLVVAGGLYAMTSNIALDIVLSVTLFVAVYSARQYSRSLGYARLKPLVTATGDITYVVSGIVLIAIVMFSQGDNTSVSQMLLSLAAANLVAMFIERWRLHGLDRKWFTFADVKKYGHVWLQSRWALVGALTTLFLAQAHGLIITWFNGPGTFAPLAAGMVLFGPVRVALLTWQNMVKPELAMALSDNQAQAVKKQISKTVVLMGSAVLAMGVVLWFLWPHIHELLYAKQYADQPMGLIVCMWFAITLFAAIYNAPSAALQAMRDFKVLAMASVYGAVISGILVTLFLFYINPESTLLGILAAECFMAVYLTIVMLKRLNEETQ
jgi:O-antigen/teichoic acid export membrane protein